MPSFKIAETFCYIDDFCEEFALFRQKSLIKGWLRVKKEKLIADFIQVGNF